MPLTHSESGVHKVLVENGCTLPVPMEFVDLSTQKSVPYIKMSHWISFLGSTERLHYLTGVKSGAERRNLCREFWSRVEHLHPDLPLFSLAREGKLVLEDTVPLLHHGDEGRTYRKSPIMILSTHGALGKGCSQSESLKNPPKSLKEDPLKLNFLGSTVTTHYIFAALPSGLYKNTPQDLDTILCIYATDMRQLALDGAYVSEDGARKRLFFWTLGVKGDLPYLGKAGHFSRTYSMGPKKASSKKPCSGICFKCDAGNEALGEPVPWEDFRKVPTWIKTVGLDPGLDPHGPLMMLPHADCMSLFHLDLWHIFHLGAGKSFAASALTAVLYAMANRGTIDKRLEILSGEFRAYNKSRKQYGGIRAITRELLEGGWHKGFVTTRLMDFLEYYLEKEFNAYDDALMLEIVLLKQ